MHLFQLNVPHKAGCRAALAIFAILALLAGACARPFPSEQVPKMKWLILPFAQPQQMSENTLMIRGWWLGASTVRQNERAGDLLAENINRAMARLDFLSPFSTIDLKYYFANKTRRLKDAYPALTDAELAQLMANVPRLEFARELGADKMLTGRIIQQYMSENRTIEWYWSVIEVEVAVVNVADGKEEWKHHYRLRTQLASMMDMQEELAAKLIKDLEQEYFLPMTKK